MALWLCRLPRISSLAGLYALSSLRISNNRHVRHCVPVLHGVIDLQEGKSAGRQGRTHQAKPRRSGGILVPAAGLLVLFVPGVMGARLALSSFVTPIRSKRPSPGERGARAGDDLSPAHAAGGIHHVGFDKRSCRIHNSVLDQKDNNTHHDSLKCGRSRSSCTRGTPGRQVPRPHWPGALRRLRCGSSDDFLKMLARVMPGPQAMRPSLHIFFCWRRQSGKWSSQSSRLLTMRRQPWHR